MAISEEEAAQYPPPLQPKDEDVDGVIEGYDQASTKFSANAIIATIRGKDGKLGSLWLTSTVLRSQFSRLRPKVGEHVVVRYLGMREGANGSYHDFRVLAPDRPPFEPDWSALEGDSEEDESYSYPSESAAG